MNPTELIVRFEVLGNAFGFGELGGNEVDLLIGLAVDVDEVLRQGVLYKHQREGVRLMLLEILLPHPPKQPRSEIDKYLDGLVYEMNHTNDTVTILVDAIFAILIALIELASHYTKEVILFADLRHELQNIRQFESDRAFLKENKLHTHDDLDRDVEQTEAQIAALEIKRGKVRNQIRHETDPTVLAENKEQRAAITAEITGLRNRVKRVKRIRKDTPRLLGLLKTELRREYERKHPIKEQQRTHRNEPER